MSRTTFMLLAIAAGSGCASSTATSRSQATPVSPRELALEVAQGGMSEEAYRSMLLALSQTMQNTMERMASADGRKLPPDAAKFIAEVIGEEMSYEKVTSIMADLYVRHFTEAELQELAAFRRAPVSQKLNRLITALMSESGERMTEVLISRRQEISAKVKARFGDATSQVH